MIITHDYRHIGKLKKAPFRNQGSPGLFQVLNYSIFFHQRPDGVLNIHNCGQRRVLLPEKIQDWNSATPSLKDHVGKRHNWSYVGFYIFCLSQEHSLGERCNFHPVTCFLAFVNLAANCCRLSLAPSISQHVQNPLSLPSAYLSICKVLKFVLILNSGMMMLQATSLFGRRLFGFWSALFSSATWG